MRLDHLLSKENFSKDFIVYNVFLKSQNHFYGAVAQLARAPALQAGGQEFDSPQLHHIDNFKTKIIWIRIINNSTLKNI